MELKDYVDNCLNPKTSNHHLPKKDEDFKRRVVKAASVKLGGDLLMFLTLGQTLR